MWAWWWVLSRIKIILFVLLLNFMLFCPQNPGKEVVKDGEGSRGISSFVASNSVILRRELGMLRWRQCRDGMGYWENIVEPILWKDEEYYICHWSWVSKARCLQTLCRGFIHWLQLLSHKHQLSSKLDMYALQGLDKVTASRLPSTMSWNLWEALT